MKKKNYEQSNVDDENHIQFSVLRAFIVLFSFSRFPYCLLMPLLEMMILGYIDKAFILLYAATFGIFYLIIDLKWRKMKIETEQTRASEQASRGYIIHGLLLKF